MVETNTILNFTIPIIGSIIAYTVYKFEKNRELRDVKFRLVNATIHMFSVSAEMKKVFLKDLSGFRQEVYRTTTSFKIVLKPNSTTMQNFNLIAKTFINQQSKGADELNSFLDDIFDLIPNIKNNELR